jgi:hypothetical protein
MQLKMKKNKKSQFMILSMSFLILLLFFSYSLETQNTYIVKSSKHSILNNIIEETCYIGKNSNGSNIESRYSNFTIDVKNYCNNINYICNLTITNNTVLPSNESLINYTLFDYNIIFEANEYSYSNNFNC